MIGNWRLDACSTKLVVLESTSPRRSSLSSSSSDLYGAHRSKDKFLILLDRLESGCEDVEHYIDN